MLLSAWPGAAHAELSVKASFYPGNLDVSLGETALLERVALEIKPRGADLPVACAWDEALPSPGTRLALPCRAGEVRGTLLLEETEPGVVTAVVELEREEALAGEGGLQLTAILSGVGSGVALARSEPWWLRPVFFRQQAFLGDELQLVLGKRAKDHVALLPLAAGGATGFARGANLPVSGGGLTTALQAWAPWSVKRAPILVVAAGRSPYALVHSAYRQGLAAMGRPGRMREEKPYPEAFNKVGFCTWNSFYEDQTEANLTAAARAFRDAKFPLGFFIIDAGWQDYAPGSVFFQKLRSFSVDSAKLPNGLKPVVAEIREATGARVGIWHALQGVPGGIDPASPLAREQAEHLWRGAHGELVPDPTSERGRGFYTDLYRFLKDSGIEIVKVDFQNWLERPLRGQVPVHQGMQQAIYNFHAAAKDAFGDNVINCMSMGHDALLSLRDTNVVRNSLDYLLPPGPLGHRRHVLNNLFNSVAVQQVAYPDFDMWEAHGDFATFHSVLRAISGGPVYFTGDVAKQDWALLRRLVLADGTLLRADQPALPTADSLYVDASSVPVPLKAFTRVGRTGMLAAFNVHEGGGPVAGSMQPSDVEGLEGGRFAVYEFFSRRMRLAGPADSVPVKLGPSQAELYWVAPIEGGTAVLGLVDKYVGPKALISQRTDGSVLRVELAEGGKLGAYLEKRPLGVKVDGAPALFTWRLGGWLEVTVPAGAGGPHLVEISRWRADGPVAAAAKPTAR